MKLRIILMLMTMLLTPKVYSVVDPITVTVGVSAATAALCAALIEAGKLGYEYIYGTRTEKSELEKLQLAVAQEERAERQEYKRLAGIYWQCQAENRPGSKRSAHNCKDFAQAFIKFGRKEAFDEVYGK